MGDQVIHNVLALVMIYEDSSRQWVPCGNPLQYANIYILYNDSAKIYRFYGIDGKDGEVILDSEIYKGLKYNKATPIFHQWRDISRQVFGLKFESAEDAEGFASATVSVLELAFRTQRKSTEVPPTSFQPPGVVEQSIKTANQTPLITSQHQNTQSGIQQIWASQEQPAADTGRVSSSLTSRMTQAEPVPIQSRPSHVVLPAEQPVNSQQRSVVASEATPFQVRPAPVESANGGFNQMRRQSSQPMYEQSNISTNNTSMSQQSTDDDHYSLTRVRSASYGNALDEAAVVSARLSQHADQPSNKLVAPAPAAAPAPPPPPPPPIPAGAGGLAEALKASALRRTSKPPVDEPAKNHSSGGTLTRSGGAGAARGLDMMSEMARRLEERRAKSTDSDGGAAVKVSTSNGPPTAEKVPAPVTPAKVSLAPAPSNAGKDSPKFDRKWQAGQPSSNSSAVPSNVTTIADLENLKKELTNVMRNEIAAAKQEILDAISKMLNR